MGFFAKSFPVEPIENIKSTNLLYNELADLSDNFSFEFCNSGFMVDSHIYTCNSIPVYKEPTTIRQIIDENASEKYYIGDNLKKWEYLKGSKKIPRTSKNGHEYTFSEGPIAFPDPIDKPARTMLTSESSVNRSTHVIEDPKTKQLRLITPIEAERIQGFDDNWTDTGMPEKFRYFCMGNALVVGLITKMGDILNRIFVKENNENENKERKVI